MKPNQFPDVSGGPSWRPSRHARERRANSAFVSGVSAVSALSGLVGLGREKPAEEAGERLVRPMPSVLRQVRQMQQPSGQQQTKCSRWNPSGETQAGRLGPQSSLVCQMYQAEKVSCATD